MTDPARAQEVAGRLTKAQRDWLLAAKETVFEDMALPAYIEGKRISRLTIQAIERAGLVYGPYPPKMWLNKTGLEVRRILQETQHDQ